MTASTPANIAATLERHGYVVVPQALSAVDIADLTAEFDTISHSKKSVNPNFRGLRFVSRPLRKRFGPMLRPHVKRATRGVVNGLRVGIYYATELGIEFDWHIDSSTYFVYPRFVNVWIPLRKPDPRRSGLSIVDKAKFAERYPDLSAAFAGRGAIRLAPQGDKAVFFDNDHLRYHEIPEAELPDDVIVHPELGPGDALLINNDTFHRTPDAETDRLAVSFRFVPAKATITRQTLTTMGAAKFNNMARMRDYFVKRLATFDVTGRDELTMDEYDQWFYAIRWREKERCAALGVVELDPDQFDELVFDMTLEARTSDHDVPVED